MSEMPALSQRWCLYHWQAIDIQGNIQQGSSIEASKDGIYQQLFAASLQPLEVQ